MRTKRKCATGVLLAIIVLVSMICCFAISNPNIAQCSQNVVAEEVNVALATSNGNEDFSSYTDQELPDQFDRKNISQYVPVDKFNVDGTTIYNGRNYGFIIYSSAKTNHVLIFKETYTKTASNDYEVEFKVIYANAFFKTGSNILNANSPYTIALSNVNVSEFILDADMQNNFSSSAYTEDTDSPYFSRAGLSGEISFLDKDKTSDDVAISLIDVEPKLDVEKTDAYNVADLTVNATKYKNNLANTSLGQTTGLYYKFSKHQKCIDVSINAGADDFLANKSGKQDYVKASFSVSGAYDKDYYIYNNISFNICLYNSIQVRKLDRISSESVFAPTADSTSEYGILDRKTNGYDLKEYQRFTPMLYGAGSFNFAPDKARDYKFTTPDGYFATVNNMASNADNVFAVSGQNNVVGFTAELGNASSGELHGERLIAQDFIGGSFTFSNIEIAREQELKFGETYLNSEIPTYRVIKSGDVNNSLYALDTTGYTGAIALHILDEDLNIAQTSTVNGKELVINYPFAADKKYYIVCDNGAYTAQALKFQNNGDLYLGASDYQNIENLYYKFDAPKYTQYYQTFAEQIFDENANAVEIYNGDAFLEEGKTYYLLSGISKLMTNISDSHINQIISLGEVFECSQYYNEVFEFIPKVNAQYKFTDGTYDVYRNWTLIEQDVSSMYINEGDVAYQIVKRQKGGTFELDMEGEAIKLGFNNLSLSSVIGKNQFVFTADEKLRIQYSITPSNNVYIYDSQLNLLAYDHGYPLMKGKNYIIIEGNGDCAISIEEYLQKVDAQLYVDGQKYEFDKDIYYGKDFILPVPTKERYNFIGWKNGDVFVTDRNGQSIKEILSESVVLTAGWELRGAVIKTTSNGSTFWWDGQKMVTDGAVTVFNDGDIDGLRQAVIAAFENTPECIEEGYYASSFGFTLTSSNENTDYYTLTPNWKIERYKITFKINSITYHMTGSVEYGATVTTNNFPAAIFEPGDASYSISGWTVAGSDKVFSIKQNGTVEDYTPGVGSKKNSSGYTEVTLTAKINYVTYKLHINNKYYEVPRSGYELEGLQSYGFNADDYVGKNVWFTDNKNNIYYLWKKVYPTDFSAFWKPGMTTVVIYLDLKFEYVKIKLKYKAYSYNYKEEKFWINDNPEYYCGGKVTLKDPTIKGWKFDGWEFGNKKVSEIDYKTLGFKIYTSWAEDLGYGAEFTTTLLADERGFLSNTRAYLETPIDVMRIDGDGKTYDNIEFIVSPSVKELTFINGTWNNTSIKVESRSNLCTINFDKVYMKAPQNQCVLYSEDLITLESFNSTKLEAGDVTSANAQPAILTRGGIMFFGEEFIIRGGNGIVSGLDGTEGIRGISLISGTNCYDGALTSSAKKLYVYGGNGAQGIIGRTGAQGVAQQQQTGETGGIGGKGGNGACAINISSICIANIGVIKDCELFAYGGAGGKGGTGGTGGQGSVGRDGKFGVTTINPGNGGNGGTGGTGGNGSVGIIYKYAPFVSNSGDSSKIEAHGGEGGEAGDAGKAGKAGPTAYTMYGNPREASDGAPGAQGEPGSASDDNSTWSK